MEKRNWKIFAILCAAAVIVTLFIDWRMTLGFMLGAAVSVGTYFLTEHFCDMALSMRNSGGTMGHFILNYMIWAAVLVLCANAPQLFNILACAFGLVMVKVSLISGELFRRK